MTYKTNKIALLAVILSAGALFAACSSDSPATNPGPIQQPDSGAGTGGSNTGGQGGSGNTGGGNTGGKAGGNTGGKAGGNTGGTGATDGGPTTADGGPEAGTGGAPLMDGAMCAATGTDNCWECTGGAMPSTTNDSVQFLNGCTNNSCIKFDNAAAGIPATLPALP